MPLERLVHFREVRARVKRAKVFKVIVRVCAVVVFLDLSKVNLQLDKHATALGVQSQDVEELPIVCGSTRPNCAHGLREKQRDVRRALSLALLLDSISSRRALVPSGKSHSNPLVARSSFVAPTPPPLSAVPSACSRMKKPIMPPPGCTSIASAGSCTVRHQLRDFTPGRGRPES